MKRGKRSWALGILLALAAACGQASSSGGGSNTNWLRRCVDDSQCGGSLACWCGVCTPKCTADDACTALDPQAQCTTGTSCSSAPAPGSACAIRCQSNSNCAAGFFCSDGMCKSNATPSGDHCATERSAREAFIASSSTCKTDDDCQATASSCSEGGLPCTQSFYLNTNADLAEFARLSDALRACTTDPARGPDTCSDAVCDLVPPAPRCGALGRCEGSTQPLSCNDHILELTSGMGEVLNGADKACQIDADCAAISLSSSCYVTCDAGAVAASSAAAVQLQIDTLANSECPAYLQKNCPSPPNLLCLPGFPECASGTCRWSNALNCDTAHAEIANLMLQAEAAAPRDCVTNADCTTIARANTCYDGCSSDAISLSAAGALIENFDAIGREKCPAVQASGCSFPIPPCAPPSEVLCDMGKCTFR